MPQSPSGGYKDSMNIKQIKALAQILAQNDLSALEINEGKRASAWSGRPRSPWRNLARVGRATHAGGGRATHAEAPASAPMDDPGVDFNDVFEAKSPLVGVFYAAPSPGAEPFVRVGSHVKKGDVLCIVEAMKLMNEIQAERDGEIVDICVHDGDVVEFGQTLFKLYER